MAETLTNGDGRSSAVAAEDISTPDRDSVILGCHVALLVGETPHIAEVIDVLSINLSVSRCDWTVGHAEKEPDPVQTSPNSKMLLVTSNITEPMNRQPDLDIKFCTNWSTTIVYLQQIRCQLQHVACSHHYKYFLTSHRMWETGCKWLLWVSFELTPKLFASWHWRRAHPSSHTHTLTCFRFGHGSTSIFSLVLLASPLQPQTRHPLNTATCKNMDN